MARCDGGWFSVDCADASQAVVLRVQHDLAVSTDHARRPAWLLHTERLRREGIDGYHYPAVDDRVSDAGDREHAADVRRASACRSVPNLTQYQFSSVQNARQANVV